MNPFVHLLQDVFDGISGPVDYVPGTYSIDHWNRTTFRMKQQRDPLF